MLRLPSLFKSYDSHVSCDPALKQPPVAPTQGTDEDKAAYAKAMLEYIATLTACHDTGDWSPLILPGETPLKFVLQPVDAEDFRALVDRASLPESSPRHIGAATEQALLVRLALVSIVGTDDIKIRREADPKWDGWVMAQPEVIRILDSVNRRIVGELAQAIGRRSIGPGKP